MTLPHILELNSRLTRWVRRRRKRHGVPQIEVGELLANGAEEYSKGWAHDSKLGEHFEKFLMPMLREYCRFNRGLTLKQHLEKEHHYDFACQHRGSNKAVIPIDAKVMRTPYMVFEHKNRKGSPSWASLLRFNGQLRVLVLDETGKALPKVYKVLVEDVWKYIEYVQAQGGRVPTGYSNEGNSEFYKLEWAELEAWGAAFDITPVALSFGLAEHFPLWYERHDRRGRPHPEFLPYTVSKK